MFSEKFHDYPSSSEKMILKRAEKQFRSVWKMIKILTLSNIKQPKTKQISSIFFILCYFDWSGISLRNDNAENVVNMNETLLGAK